MIHTIRIVRWNAVLFGSLAVSLLLSACGGANNHAASELTISAAASLTDALGELGHAYERAHPGAKLSFNFGASGALQQQIEQGAPVDLFLSAAAKNMKALADKGLLLEQSDLLRNELVVVVPKPDETDDRQHPAEVADLADLSNAKIKKIGIGIPESVPAGGYAKEALTASGLWDGLQAKLVQGKDVRQVLQYVETANADAGFVYQSDALTSDKSTVAFAVDPALYEPIIYPAAIVKATEHAEAARDFYGYLRSPEAMAVFAKYGFTAAAAE
ncbi:molybdate ABC transporter substrate-binding protein [Cohnella sp. JJ-181]|uniref:molybdate ABC transporter substrate-binding protein n=1 Tax=Cohnella rhizoplanae TaxID=2974897 RepID=UPI0022FF5348|nr:molybdate ABC transporter substrate-binding protein [Cohnella sp. JJ-181]CAI6081638.1 Molybdate-binding protein ModA [Cohnella sp. JJ-181]